MLTVIIPRTDEPKVILYTQDNLIKELYPINGAELLVEDTWWHGVNKAKTPFVCMVEPDCLVSSGYFASNLGLFQKNPYYRKLAMVASATGVRNFANRIYNYEFGQVASKWSDPDGNEMELNEWAIVPNKDKRSTSLYPTQVGFVPGAIIRTSAIQERLAEFAKLSTRNLVELSARISFTFWDSGRRVEVNPNSTYVSNEAYLEDPPQLKVRASDKAQNIFQKEGI